LSAHAITREAILGRLNALKMPTGRWKLFELPASFCEREQAVLIVVW